MEAVAGTGKASAGSGTQLMRRFDSSVNAPGPSRSRSAKRGWVLSLTSLDWSPRPIHLGRGVRRHLRHRGEVA
jgi:hypothetical protein